MVVMHFLRPRKVIVGCCCVVDAWLHNILAKDTTGKDRLIEGTQYL